MALYPKFLMINRRNLLIGLAGTSSILVSPLKSAKASPPRLLKPKRLQAGSVVGIVSPASATFVREELEIVIDAVKALELVPRLAPHLLERYGYLAGKDKERAADINQFFSDVSVAAILPIRGGWGCSRILPYLDYKRIQQNPKIIIGFSDLTALILALNAKTNLVQVGVNKPTILNR
jgi:muramoyltetrapeptide carboxypeptidase